MLKGCTLLTFGETEILKTRKVWDLQTNLLSAV